ncbi:MAG: hypothetical protein EOO60_05905 [Hymenobacter sp.]|nr:MAG: hypothetical protein EOO60_05905 [Hymenobacter sp.]
MRTRTVTKQWAGCPIKFELANRKVVANATSMCVAHGKNAIEWATSEATQFYIQALKVKPATEVMLAIRPNGSVWIHEELIGTLTRWLGVEFEVQCEQWLADILSPEKVELLQRNSFKSFRAAVRRFEPRYFTHRGDV